MMAMMMVVVMTTNEEEYNSSEYAADDENLLMMTTIMVMMVMADSKVRLLQHLRILPSRRKLCRPVATSETAAAVIGVNSNALEALNPEPQGP